MANICFDCKKAVPKTGEEGCPWATKFKPVPGWYAELTILKHHLTETLSYDVRECPLFEEG